MSETQLRTFIAIYPSAKVIENVSNLQHELKAALGSKAIRWVPPNQIHLTLKFLGDVPSASIDEIKIAIRSACADVASFPVATEGLGVFPNERRPQVLWCGLAGDVGSCHRLQRNIDQQTTRWSQPESKPFRPHLTIARLKDIRPPEARNLATQLKLRSAVPLGSWIAESVFLMESRLSSGGAQHFPLAQIALGSQSCAS